MRISSASQLQPSGLLYTNVGCGKRHRGPVSREDQGQWRVQNGNTGEYALIWIDTCDQNSTVC